MVGDRSEDEQALQFHLLPIRDWNGGRNNLAGLNQDCNFTYSLLGIETRKLAVFVHQKILQFHLLPIRDWNLMVLILFDGRSWYCNFTYSLLGIETFL